MSITLLSGTNRPGSNTRRVTAVLEKLYQEAGHPVNVLDLADLPAEVFSPGSYAEKPAGFEPFAEAVLASHGLHVVTPEYNGGFPGVLKYFIDLLPFPESFEHRPVAFTGLAAGQWGALRAVEQLQAIFGYRNAYLFPERVFIPGIGRLFATDGQLQDENLMIRLRQQVKGFAEFSARFDADDHHDR